MITIYHLGLSQSDRVVWLMEELGLPYKMEVFVRHESGYAPQELFDIHPLGRAPVIRDGDKVLAESSAIVEYICTRLAKGQLWVSPDADNYADFLFWYHFGPSSLSNMASFKMIAHRHNYENLDHIVRHWLRQMDLSFEIMDKRLGEVPFLAGEEFTAAEIMIMYPITTWARYNGTDLSGHKNISDYIRRVEARPAYQRAMDIAGPDRGAGIPPVYTMDDPDGAS
ncbi:MAG: glutathione S-transferase family protein [Novosphingobium sp.]